MFVWTARDYLIQDLNIKILDSLISYFKSATQKYLKFKRIICPLLIFTLLTNQ